MSSALERVDQNYDRLRREHGAVDTRFYIGDIKDVTPEQFAEEANLVLESFLSGNTTLVNLSDSRNS